MRQKNNFTEGKIYSPLVRFSLPVLLALFLQAMYGAVDLLIVGQFGGELADVFVSAVSTGSQIMHAITIIITGLSMGLTVYVGMEIGAGRRDEAGKIIGAGIWMFTLISLVLTVVMVLLSSQIAMAMHAPEEAFGQTATYIRICSGGMIFIMAYNLLGSIFRGIGDSKIPLITVAIACVLNIAGDLLLVAVFRMGEAGAAIATVLAQAASVAISILIIRRRELPFSFSFRYIRRNSGYIRHMLKLGAPIAFQDLLVNISFLVVTAIVNGLGLVVSASVGVASKTIGFLMLVPSSFMQSMAAFVAQNIGAGKPERARRALRYGIITSLAVGLVIGTFTFFRGDLMAGIFARDPEIILMASEYLKAYAFDCVLTAFLFCFIGYFNGCGNTTFVMLQGILCAFGIRIPFSWIMSRMVPVSLFYIGLATPAATVVQIVISAVFFFYMTRRQRLPGAAGG